MPMSKRFQNWQGMNWIRKEKRLAIYLRDGVACVYCGKGIETKGCQLTLDHLVINNNNSPENLVTCCSQCNSTRADQPWKKFAGKTHIITRILMLTKLPVDASRAKQMLERRTWKAALKIVARRAA